MKKKNLLIFNVLIAVFLACICFSCHTKSSDLPELVKAERIMEQYPDSALHILENLSDSVHLSTEQNAMYCLLLTEARDKTYETHKSDSLINIAVNYFDDRDDLNLKAKAWFYKGRVTQSLLDSEQALDCYLKSASYAESANYNKLLSMSYNYLAILYRQQNIFDKAQEKAQKAIDISILTNDSTNISYALRNMGRVYLLMKETDSAFVYFQKALAIAEKFGQLDTEASILNDIGATYRQKKDYHKAIDMVQKSIPLKSEDQKFASYLSLARLYYQLENLDSLDYYLHKASDGQAIFVQEGVNYYKYKLSLLRSDYQNALHYNLKYQEVKDSINLDKQKNEILKLTYQYDQKVLKQKLEQRATRERLTYIYCILVLLIIVILGVYIYVRSRWNHIQMLRLQDKKFQQEKELRLQSLDQILENKRQIESNEQKLISKEADLRLVQRDLLIYNTKYLNVENELISLRREELEFRNRLFCQTGYAERIRAAGVDTKKIDVECEVFTMKHFPDLIQVLNELYDNFVIRLQKHYPLLKERDIEICCLLKAGAKTGNIAFIIAMTPNAVTKKKRQILEKMDIIEGSISLEQFLSTF